MNTQKLNSAITEFVKKKKSNAAYYEENWAERKERKNYYQSFSKDKLLAMTEEEFLEYISKLWSMLIWGNKKYVVDKMIADNGFASLKKQLAELLYGTSPIEKRWDVFLKSIKGMGPATISELLTYANPQEYVIFNKTTILCYGYLDISDMPKYNYQYTGKKYVLLQKRSPQNSKKPVQMIMIFWLWIILCGMKFYHLLIIRLPYLLLPLKSRNLLP